MKNYNTWVTTIPRMVIHCSMEISVWINPSAFLSIFHHMNIHQKFTLIQAIFKTKRNETKFLVKLSYLFNGSNGRLTEFIPICDCIEKVQCCILPKITTMNIDCRSCQKRARERKLDRWIKSPRPYPFNGCGWVIRWPQNSNLNEHIYSN